MYMYTYLHGMIHYQLGMHKAHTSRPVLRDFLHAFVSTELAEWNLHELQAN